MTEVLISYLDSVARISSDVSIYIIIPLLQPDGVTDFDIGFYNLFYLIDKVKNYNECLKGACQGGHLDIVNYMIEKGAYHLEYGLYDACYGGHLDLAKHVITKGATYLSMGLEGACKGGHLNIAKYMIEKGAKSRNLALYSACEGGQLDLAKYMIENGATEWNWGLEGACKGIHLRASQAVAGNPAPKGASNPAAKDPTRLSRDHSSYDLVNYMIEKGADHCDYCGKSIQLHKGSS